MLVLRVALQEIVTVGFRKVFLLRTKADDGSTSLKSSFFKVSTSVRER